MKDYFDIIRELKSRRFKLREYKTNTESRIIKINKKIMFYEKKIKEAKR